MRASVADLPGLFFGDVAGRYEGPDVGDAVPLGEQLDRFGLGPGRLPLADRRLRDAHLAGDLALVIGAGCRDDVVPPGHAAKCMGMPIGRVACSPAAMDLGRNLVAPGLSVYAYAYNYSSTSRQLFGGRMALVLETKNQPDETTVVGPIAFTPPINEGYWLHRVRLSDEQAIVAFPKFFTIGIGFAVEEDWNTNLPFDCSAEQIYDHIAHNKGDDTITREDCLTAIRMIQDAVRADRSGS